VEQSTSGPAGAVFELVSVGVCRVTLRPRADLPAEPVPQALSWREHIEMLSRKLIKVDDKPRKHYRSKLALEAKQGVDKRLRSAKVRVHDVADRVEPFPPIASDTHRLPTTRTRRIGRVKIRTSELAHWIILPLNVKAMRTGSA
jgi:hypothetical protein